METTDNGSTPKATAATVWDTSHLIIILSEKRFNVDVLLCTIVVTNMYTNI